MISSNMAFQNARRARKTITDILGAEEAEGILLICLLCLEVLPDPRRFRLSLYTDFSWQHRGMKIGERAIIFFVSISVNINVDIDHIILYLKQAR
jgi:hypothetical protein